MQGQAFRFTLEPPPADRLTGALLLSGPPDAPLPRESRGSRWRRFFGGRRAVPRSKDESLLWRYYDAVREVLGAVLPLVSRTAYGLPAKPLKGRILAGRPVQHPYQLKPAFDLLTDLPDTLPRERRYLGDLLRSILVTYLQMMADRPGGPVVFHRQAQEYFYAGYRGEKLLSSQLREDDKLVACQAVYDNYGHAIHYYTYALLAGEVLEPVNQLFMFFCNALHFRARIGWDGQILPQPTAKALPARHWVLFYALHDRTLLGQFKGNPEAIQKFREVLRVFPEAPGSVRPAKPQRKNIVKQGSDRGPVTWIGTFLLSLLGGPRK